MLSHYSSPKPYPFIHPDGKIFYVPVENEFIQAARRIAESSGCVKQATGAVVVVNGKIVATGSNAGLRVNVCPRILEKCPTGTGYHHCKETCKQDGHAEQMAAKNFLNKKIVQPNPILYLWGHWWCCESCWQAMLGIGISTVYLIEGATELFDLDASKKQSW